MLKIVDDLWGKVLAVLMGIAAVYVALIMIAIIYASAFRFFGIAYSQYTIPFIAVSYTHLRAHET